MKLCFCSKALDVKICCSFCFCFCFWDLMDVLEFRLNSVSDAIGWERERHKQLYLVYWNKYCMLIEWCCLCWIGGSNCWSKIMSEPFWYSVILFKVLI